MANFDLTKEQRAEIMEYLIPELENYYSNTEKLRVAPPLDIKEIRDLVSAEDFNTPEDIRNAVNMVISALRKYSVHISHPRYYGLFNPRSNFASILADLISATFNPQLAAWSHSPFAPWG